MKLNGEAVSFSKYGKSFQEGLAALILQDRAFSDQIQEVLETQYFELKYLQVFVDRIFGYKEKYNVHPTAKILLTILRTELEDETDAVKKQTRDYFSRIYNTDVRDEEFIKNTLSFINENQEFMKFYESLVFIYISMQI